MLKRHMVLHSACMQQAKSIICAVVRRAPGVPSTCCVRPPRRRASYPELLLQPVLDGHAFAATLGRLRGGGAPGAAPRSRHAGHGSRGGSQLALGPCGASGSRRVNRKPRPACVISRHARQPPTAAPAGPPADSSTTTPPPAAPPSSSRSAGSNSPPSSTSPTASSSPGTNSEPPSVCGVCTAQRGGGGGGGGGKEQSE